MSPFPDNSLVVFLPMNQTEDKPRFVPRYSYNFLRRTEKRLRPVVSTTVNFCFPGFALVRASLLDENSTPIRINGRVATITGAEANSIPFFHEMRGKPSFPRPGSYVTVCGLFGHMRFLVLRTDSEHCHLDLPTPNRKTWKVAPHLLMRPVVGKNNQPIPQTSPTELIPGPAAPFKGMDEKPKDRKGNPAIRRFKHLSSPGTRY